MLDVCSMSGKVSEWIAKVEGGTMKTESELLFEDYLRNNGYLDFEFEPPVHDKKKHPDYLVRRNGQELFFEVKQREAPAHLPADGGYDPYKGIRDEINEAARKFKEFKEYCCCLVIANRGDSGTHLAPHHIFAAMLGDLGFTFRIANSNGGHRPKAIQNVFLRKRGKMVRYKTGEYQNTTVAAVIGLEEAKVRNAEFEQMRARLWDEERRQRGRELSLDEQATLECGVAIEYDEAGRGPTFHSVPRIIVCENPGARLPLPRDSFCGLYDERWAMVDDCLTSVFTGGRVCDLRM